jgi:uncharacterized membrane protein (DUF485 family)
MNTSVYEVKPQYSFTVEQNSETHTFIYQRAKYSLAMYIPLFLMIFFVLFIFTAIFGMDITAGLFVAIIVPIAICILISKKRGKGQFQVSPSHITINGKSYDRGHINRIYFNLPSKYYNNVEIRGGFQGLGDGLRNKIGNQIEAKNYIVGFVYAEQHIKLAGGLNETSARVLHDKIKDILRLYK